MAYPLTWNEGHVLNSWRSTNRPAATFKSHELTCKNNICMGNVTTFTNRKVCNPSSITQGPTKGLCFTRKSHQHRMQRTPSKVAFLHHAFPFKYGEILGVRAKFLREYTP